MSELKNKIKEYIERYYQYHNKIPKINVISNKMGATRQSIIKIFRELEDEGYIKRNYAQYKFVEGRSREIEEEKKSNKGYLNDQVIIVITRIVMALIGICTIILSMNYISVWFGEHLTGFFQWLFSAVAVTFNVMSFEITIILWRNKYYLLSCIFFFVWMVVFVFCILAVISGQYNKRTDKIVEKNKENFTEEYKKIEFSSYNKDIDDIQDQIDPKKKRLNNLNEMIDQFDLDMKIEKKKEYDDLYSKITKLESEIDSLEKKKKGISDQQTKYLNSNKDVAGLNDNESLNRETFYQQLSDISKNSLSANDAEFWMFLLPATFLDIISAMSLAVALFLKKKEKKEKQNFILKLIDVLKKKGESK